MSMLLSLSFFFSMAFASSDPLLLALSLFRVDSTQMLFGRRRLVSRHPMLGSKFLLGILARCLDKEDAAMIVEPFLLVVRLVEGEGTGKMYRKRGGRGKEGRQGGRDLRRSAPRDCKRGEREISTLL